MMHILLSGCNGKMGHVVTQTVQGRTDCDIVAGFDSQPGGESGYPVFAQPMEFPGTADVLIDFSNPAFLPKLLEFATARRIPAVIATTGLSADDMERLHRAAAEIPVFSSANMSIGINLLTELAKKAAAVLSDSFDIEIIEMHHNQKIDAPSGTALMIANAVSSVLPYSPQYVYERHSQRKKRDRSEIGIHSVRAGTIAGEHEVIFAGRDEVITLHHSAMSRQIFATGAVNAALFLCRQKPGFYNMGDLVASIGG